jgi:hypothetical protein
MLCQFMSGLFILGQVTHVRRCQFLLGHFRSGSARKCLVSKVYTRVGHVRAS